MKRSVRNGLAVVGMAGGMWLLGHAVANAATDPAPPGPDTTVSQSVTPQNTTSSGDNTNVAAGNNDNSSSTGTGNTTGGGGGGNGASANTGATDSTATNNTAGTNTTTPTTATTNNTTTPTTNFEGDPSKPVTSVTIVTGDVTANQQANGGDVANSGNVDGTTGPVTQTATANNKVDQTSTSGDKSGDTSGSKSSSSNNSSSDQNVGSSTDQNSSSSNTGNGDGKNVAVSGNDNSTSVSTGNISGGNGGSNSVDINTGLIGNTFICPEHSTCTYNITTGNVTVYQEANGGNVTNSGNVTIGKNNKSNECGCEKAAAPPTPAPVVKTAAMTSAAKSAGVLSGAQPTGVLATTGADYSTPLTVGLLALGAGTALTLAGRRRREVEAA